MKVELRLAIKKDIPRIVEITQEHEPSSIEGYTKAFVEQVDLNNLKSSISFIFVALRDEKVVGHAKLFRYTKDLKVDYASPEGWYLNGIIVDPKYRRSGIAKRLLKYREKFILGKLEEANLYSIVSSVNEASIGYHKSLGFKEHLRAPGFLKIKLNCGEGILFTKLISREQL